MIALLQIKQSHKAAIGSLTKILVWNIEVKAAYDDLCFML